MIRGVSFEIPQLITNTLYKVLNSINISKYDWYVVENQAEVCTETFGEEFFLKKHYKGENFYNLIQSSHHILFLKIQAHSSDDSFKSIHTYNDFLKSNCELVILVYDCIYVELYIKDKNISKTIYDKVMSIGYKNINFITDANDTRTKLDVL